MPVIISYAEIFTLTTAAGINTFSQKEYVFQNDSKVSELTWDCPIIPYIELGVFLDYTILNLICRMQLLFL